MVVLPLCRKIRPDYLNVLAYHRVFVPPGPGYPFAPDTISASFQQFDAQLRFASEHFNVINFEILSDILDSGEALPRNSLIITFDDGYADNYTIAFRLLKKYGLSATVFVSTSFIESGKPFWFDEVAYRINRTRSNLLRLCDHQWSVNDDNRGKVCAELLRVLRNVTNTERLCMLKELEDQSKVAISPEDFELIRPLTTEAVKAMSQEGIEIGSHTVTHPYLSNLTDDEAVFELLESKKIIEGWTKKDVKGIAYPGGSYERRIMKIARDCGYRFGIAYDHGARSFDRNRCFDIPRIHVELETDEPLFVGGLLLPWCFARP